MASADQYFEMMLNDNRSPTLLAETQFLGFMIPPTQQPH